VTVTITEHSDKVAYDGKEHEVSGYDVEIGNPLYTEADFTFSGKDTVKGTNAGSYDMELKPEDFKNTNENFAEVTFVIVDGQLVIDPIDVKVTIVGANSTDDYDGKAHTVKGYEATASSELYDVNKDFTFSGKAEASRTNVVEGEDADGRTDMGLAAEQFENTNPNFKTVTFEVTDGYQVIEPIDATVKITGHHDALTYDGKEHKVEGYDVEIGNKLYSEEDFTFSGTAEAARTNAGTTNMNLAADQFTNNNTNFKTVTFDVTDGYIQIAQIDEVIVTITGHHNTVDYDGRNHVVSGYDVEISNDLYKESDFNFTGTDKVERTDAGKTDMGLDPSQFENTNENFAKVTFVIAGDGYVEVNPIDVTVQIIGHNNGDGVAYDGKEHEMKGYEVVIDNKLYTTEDFNFSGTDEVAGTDAGTYEMGLAPEQFTNTNPNFANVTFEVTDGYLKINQINAIVTIVGNNDTKDYDGKEHSVSGYTATANTELYDVEKDFTFSGTAEAARTDAGQTDMGLAAEQFTNTNPNFASVTFNVTDGYQKIEPITVTVTITGATTTADYDGQPHTVSGYEATASSDLFDVDKDISFSGTDSATRTDAGTTEMGLDPSQFTCTNPNFKDVVFEVTDGSVTIEAIDVTVTITGNTDSKEYNGEEQTVTGYTAEASSPLYDVNNDFTFSGSDTAGGKDVGTYTMNMDESQFKNNNNNFNITFEVTDGSIEITPKDLIVQADNKTKVYGDNDPQLTATVTGLVAGDTIDYTLSREAGEDVGRYTINVEEKTNASPFNLGVASKIGNYNVTFKSGTLTITPATLTITTPSATKQFDGTALTATNATVKGLKRGDKITVNVTGTRTQVGESRNTYTIRWGKTNADNYEIVENVGTLTITAAPPAPIPPAPVPPAPVPPAPVPPAPQPQPQPQPQPEPPTEPITEEITDPEEGPAGVQSQWALLNLILSIITCLLAIAMIILFIVGKKDEDEDEEKANAQAQARASGEGEEEEKKRRRNGLKFLGLIPAVATVILFILTEDMTQPMVLTDKWTILTAIFTLIGIVLVIVTRNRKKDDEDENKENENA